MNAQKISHDLIAGSRRIDEMKKEIDQLARMIIGLDPFRSIDKLVLLQKNILFNEGHWSLNSVEEPGNKLFFSVGCHLQRPSGVHCCYWAKTNEMRQLRSEFQIEAEEVVTVYQNLSVFVDSMVKYFPHLQQRWEYLIKASQL